MVYKSYKYMLTIRLDGGWNLHLSSVKVLINELEASHLN